MQRMEAGGVAVDKTGKSKGFRDVIEHHGIVESERDGETRVGRIMRGISLSPAAQSGARSAA